MEKNRTFALLMVIAIISGGLLGFIGYSIIRRAFFTQEGYRAPGEYALDYLQNVTYKNLLVEIDYVSSKEPASSIPGLLQARISTYANKDSVQVILSSAIPTSGKSYSLQDILSIEEKYRDLKTEGDTVTMYYLYLDASYSDATGVLAATYSASSVVVFKDEIRGVDVPAPVFDKITHDDVEESVVVHELGHLFGLVNLVYKSSLDYEDRDHPHHSINMSDPMYYAIEGVSVKDVLLGDNNGPLNDFGFETAYDLTKLRNGEYSLQLVSRDVGFAAALDDLPFLHRYSYVEATLTTSRRFLWQPVSFS